PKSLVSRDILIGLKEGDGLGMIVELLKSNTPQFCRRNTSRGCRYTSRMFSPNFANYSWTWLEPKSVCNPDGSD
ncbi:unnamed protein product, partial [Sphenostylis stenocarpa]